MKKIHVLFRVFLLVGVSFLISCSTSTELEDPGGLRAKLKSLEGVTVVELAPYYDFDREFLLEIEQPVDHADSNGATFTQTAYLLHNDAASPMILGASGYSAYADDLYEMTIALNANQIVVSHRYFSGSVPDGNDFDHLTMKQVAGDLHRIVMLLKEVYPENWMGSGFGKGGLTTLAHKRYYPNDVEAAVVYSTPFFDGQNDTRPMDYVKVLGADSTYDKIKMFQEAILKRRSEITPYIYEFMYYMYNYYNYSWMHNEDWVLEMAALDYPFDYWSFNNQDISEVPDTSESADVLFDHLYEVVWLEYYSDNYISYLEPARYQAMTELGAETFETDHIQNLLEEVDVTEGSNFYYESLLSDDLDLDYSSEGMDDLKNWLLTEGDNIVYLYGELDPYSVAAINLSGSGTNAIKIVQPGIDHYIGIEEVTDADQVYNALSDWMGFEIEPLSKTVVSSDERRIKLKLSD